MLGLVGFLQFIDRRREVLSQLAEGFDGPGSIRRPAGAICWICGVEVDRDSRSSCILKWLPVELKIT